MSQQQEIQQGVQSLPLQQLEVWVKQQAGVEPTSQLLPLSGDAGFRQYYRVTASQPPSMAVYAPPATENTALYLAVSRLLAEAKVRVPIVRATDLERGFLLVEDCGDGLLLSALNSGNADRLYSQALDMLQAMQAAVVPAGVIAEYDGQRLWDEMALFPTWFVQGLLELPFGRYEQTLLDELFDGLVTNALAQPQVLVHRDFHARNLMLHTHHSHADTLVTIDFQDAVTGPVTYDLVSLLRDCYVRWDPVLVDKWALAYREKLENSGKLSGVSEQQFLVWFDLMGLQRHIKVLGIFARLWLRDGKAGYLKDLPLVLRYTLDVAAKYPQAVSFVEWMQERVLPACRRQTWWKDIA